MVPGLIAVLLALAPAMLTAVAVVREKELGTITNFYATPVTRLEYLWGKQLPYAVISLGNFAVLFLLALVLFDVPLKGGFAALVVGAALYVLASTGIGLLVSAFTRTQIAGLLVTLIVTLVPAFLYSGLLTPVASLVGQAELVARGFPAMYFLNITVGTFTKGLGFAELWTNHVALAAFFAGFSLLSMLLLARQAR